MYILVKYVEYTKKKTLSYTTLYVIRIQFYSSQYTVTEKYTNTIDIRASENMNFLVINKLLILRLWWWVHLSHRCRWYLLRRFSTFFKKFKTLLPSIFVNHCFALIRSYLVNYREKLYCTCESKVN